MTVTPKPPTKPPPTRHPVIPGVVAKPTVPTIAQAMYPNLPSTEPTPKGK
jgi:hypothetical protein